jgi:hypothetical protein
LWTYRGFPHMFFCGVGANPVCDCVTHLDFSGKEGQNFRGGGHDRSFGVGGGVGVRDARVLQLCSANQSGIEDSGGAPQALRHLHVYVCCQSVCRRRSQTGTSYLGASSSDCSLTEWCLGMVWLHFLSRVPQRLTVR